MLQSGMQSGDYRVFQTDWGEFDWDQNLPDAVNVSKIPALQKIQANLFLHCI